MTAPGYQNPEESLAELRTAILALGYTEEEVDVFLGGGSPQLPPEVEQLITAYQSDTTGSLGLQEPGNPESGGVITPSGFKQAEVIAEVLAAGGTLSPDQQAAIDEDDGLLSDVQAIIDASQVAEERYDYRWVYNELQISDGALEDNESLLQLYNSMIAVGVIEPVGSEELSDDEKVITVKEILTRSPANQMVQIAVIEWARDHDDYNTAEEQAQHAMVQAGISFGRAEVITKVAAQHEIDPIQLAQIWTKTQDNAGLEPGGKPELRSSVAPDGVLGPPVKRVAENFAEGLEMYENSNLLASVHVFDPELAKRLSSDPYSLDGGELTRALEYASASGGEGAEGDPQVSWILNRLAGQYDQRVEVDTTQVTDAFKTIAAAWNMEGSEGMAAALAGQVMAEAVSRARAQLPNPFRKVQGGEPITIEESVQDISAHVKERLRSHPEYASLFGNIQSGESEEEYAGRFDRRTQQVFGDDNVQVARNAMRSGNINTPYQQGLLTEKGESSTNFQEIIARNARIFRELL